MDPRRDVDEPSVKAAFWTTLRQDPADPRDIARAYWRFTRASPPQRAPFRVARWLFVGFVAGVGVVSAATAARHVVARWTTLAPVEGSHANPIPSARRSPASRARSVPPVSSVALAAPDVPSAAVPTVPPHAVAPAPEVRTPPVLDPKWQRVSEALRSNDYTTAETALRELETRGTPSDRESASLSLAQILLARGRGPEARPRLERLSRAARSSLVREKAGAMLAGMNPSADRSARGPADTH